MNLKQLERQWDRNAKLESMRSIIWRNDKSKNWKWDQKAFFDTGITEIEELFNYIDSLKFEIQNIKALDFGCGIGRLTQALALHYDEVYGVDISSSMIEEAKKINMFDNCTYIHNPKDDLCIFESETINLIYSNLVLQHINPVCSLNYISEFIRILDPNGLLIFQLPCGRNSNYQNIPTKIKQKIRLIIPSLIINFFANKILINRPYYEMHYIEREKLIMHIMQNNGIIVDIIENNVAPGYISLRYCVTK